MNTDSALSMLSRYEALFELAGNINAATEISEAAHILARRLKYVADVFSWRYCRVEPATPGSEELTALVVDGYRGEATISHLPAAGLSEIERDLWETRRTRTLTGADLERVRSALPEHFQKPDLSQIYVCPRFIAGAPHGMHMFSKRREPFNDLDIKFLTLAAHTFHDKVHILREQQKRRELETAYLEQEIMLRQSEKLATLGRMSAGIAHEVNNPAAAALRSAQHLADGLGRLEHAAAAVGRLGLDETQTAALEKYRMHALEAVAEPPALDPVSAAEQEEEVEAWLEERSVGDPSMLAPALVAIGWGREQLDQVATSFTDAQVPAILTLLAQLHEANVLLGGIRSATGRVSRIVNALKSYS